MTRPVPGGSFLLIGNQSFTDYTVSEINLAGDTLHSITQAAANSQLAALGQPQIIDFNHEAMRLPNGYTAIIAHNEALYTNVQGGTPQNPVDIMGDEVLVLDTNWNIVWTWNAFDWLPVSRQAPLNEQCHPCAATQTGACCPVTLAPKANDWLHGNSLAYDNTDGNLIMSLRDQDWVVKIAYADATGDGHIVWTLGAGGNFTMLNTPNIPSPWFSHQHDVEVWTGYNPKELTLFDNGNTRRQTDPNADSRGQVLTIDETTLTADIHTNVDFSFYCSGYGTSQILDNGNYWFQAGVVGGQNRPRSHPRIRIRSLRLLWKQSLRHRVRRHRLSLFPPLRSLGGRAIVPAAGFLAGSRSCLRGLHANERADRGHRRRELAEIGSYFDAKRAFTCSMRSKNLSISSGRRGKPFNSFMCRPSPDQFHPHRLTARHGAVQLLPSSIGGHRHRATKCRHGQADAIAQRQPQIAAASQQRPAKLSLAFPKPLPHFKLQFPQRCDCLFRRHSGRRQPANPEIYRVNAGSLHNLIHSLAAALIEHHAEATRTHPKHNRCSRVRPLFVLMLGFRPAIPNQFFNQVPARRNILADLLPDFSQNPRPGGNSKCAGFFHFYQHCRTFGEAQPAAHRRRNQDPSGLFQAWCTSPCLMLTLDTADSNVAVSGNFRAARASKLFALFRQAARTTRKRIAAHLKSGAIGCMTRAITVYTPKRCHTTANARKQPLTRYFFLSLPQ